MYSLRHLAFLLVTSFLIFSDMGSSNDSFLMGSIGDSWAAGAALPYSKDLYDNDNGCLRNKNAWEAQMAGDTSWTNNTMDFSFAACSGARLIAAAEGDPEISQTAPQLSFVGSPHLLTMELGGNDCHFAEIAKACIYIGQADGKEYPDPGSACTQLITTWESYILSGNMSRDESFYFDHHQTLIEIMAWDTVTGRDDFYLYITGYGEFFNTSPGSDWCNDQSFGALFRPKLTNVLRSKLNQLVSEVNSKISQSVQDMNNNHIGYLDPSPLFEDHRFCEPGHTFSNQYFLNDVWLWNLSPPEDDPDYGGSPTAPLKAIWQSEWIANQTFPNGTRATQDQIEAMLDGSNPSSSGRTFHPKNGGHTAIKNAMIAMLRSDNVPGVKPAAPNPPPEKQPYASGEVHIHVYEYWGCLDDANNLSVNITMWDSSGTQIGFMNRTQAGASAPARMVSKLEDPLIVTPEWANGGYIQFQLGNLQFNTNDDRNKSQPVYCVVGGYDPKEGPTCWTTVPPGPPIHHPDAVAINQIDCYFPALLKIPREYLNQGFLKWFRPLRNFGLSS